MEPELVLDADGVSRFLDEVWPGSTRAFSIDQLSPGYLLSTHRTSEANLRPGGTLSGPTQMTVIDLASYLAVLAHIGPEALAVTSSMTMAFLRRAPQRHLVCATELLKLGRTQAVLECRLYAGAAWDGSDGASNAADHALGPVLCHAQVTYSRALTGP